MKTVNKVISILFLIGAIIMFAATINHLAAQEAPKKPQPVSTKDTVIKGIKYPLYVGSKGGKYILKISGKTGKPYKRYFTAKKD